MSAAAEPQFFAGPGQETIYSIRLILATSCLSLASLLPGNALRMAGHTFLTKADICAKKILSLFVRLRIGFKEYCIPSRSCSWCQIWHLALALHPKWQSAI